MAYCGPRGIPYDVWLGVADSWTERSRLAALVWSQREASRCPACGQVHEDWLGPDGEELRVPPFEVVERFCLGCDSLKQHRLDKTGDRDPAYHETFRPTSASPPDAPVDGTLAR